MNMTKCEICGKVFTNGSDLCIDCNNDLERENEQN